jgi:hypothetical protein
MLGHIWAGMGVGCRRGLAVILTATILTIQRLL